MVPEGKQMNQEAEADVCDSDIVTYILEVLLVELPLTKPYVSCVM